MDGIRQMRIAFLFFFSVVAPACASPERGSAPSKSTTGVNGWKTYVNVTHGYTLAHPPDWQPFETSDGRLYYFVTPKNPQLDFQVMGPYEPGETLESLFRRMEPNLAQAEGASYLLDQVRRLKLGENQAIEIPSVGTDRYRLALFLIDVGGRIYFAPCQVDSDEETVRRVLATLTRHAS